MPETESGRWAGRLLIVAVLLIGAFSALVASGQRGGDTFFSNLWLSVTILGGAGAALAAGCLGGVALRHGDRSAVAILAVVVGALVLLYSAAEIAFPH